ncbi:MAG: CAP domain-containing protein [Planctomycetota bacterium]|jgi:uncharacterized protein YkwD
MRKPLPLLTAAVLVAILGLFTPSLADKIYLKDGRVLEGEVVKEEKTRIRIKMDLGSVWVDREEILRIEKVPPPREIYEKRKRALSPKDAQGWFDLGVFCQEKGLTEEAEASFRAALKASPDHAGAKARLNAILANREVEALLKAPDPDEILERTAKIILLEEAGEKALKEALKERDKEFVRFDSHPEPLSARLASEFKKLRDRIRRIVLNEALYTDKALETKAKVEEDVRRLRAMVKDPGALEILSLHPPLGRMIEDVSRLEKALADFRHAEERPPPKPSQALQTLQEKIRARSFPFPENPHAKENLKISAYNEKRANALSLYTIEREGIRAVNDYRDWIGLRRLRISASLYRAATKHSRAMVEHGFFSHTSPLKGLKTPYARIRKAGYDFKIAGENIARKKGGMSAQEALDAWIASPGHHRNLLRPELEDLGLAVNGEYWTLDLGRQRKEAEKD